MGLDTESGPRRGWKLGVRLELERWSEWFPVNSRQPSVEEFAERKGQSQETEPCKWCRKELRERSEVQSNTQKPEAPGSWRGRKKGK